MSQLVSSRSVVVFLLLLAIFIIISACTSPEGNVADGKRWYTMHTCYACHGKDGNGRRGGPSIAGLNMGHRSFVQRLRNPQTAIMPKYSAEKINDQDAADILAFLKSLK